MLYAISTPGFIYLVFGGLEGIICFLYVIRFLKYFNIKKSIKYGVLGCVLLGLNILLILLSGLISPNIIRNLLLVFYLDVGFLIIYSCFFLVLGIFFLRRKDIEFEAIVRKIILELGINYTRLKISEIAEKTKALHTSIIAIVNNMIENSEIYAEYFESSQSVAFNLQANIEEIDHLMEIYEKWETDRMGKKTI